MGPVRAQGDLAGAPSRTPFDGKPDLSGVWQNEPQQPQSLTLNDKPYATLRDIGAGYRLGLPLFPWSALLKHSRMTDVNRAKASATCADRGNQQLNAGSAPRRIVHAPAVISIVYDRHQGARQIFTDGRPRRNEGAQRFSHGYSRGAWQGDTLVVLTTHFREGSLDRNGSPLTVGGRTVERFQRVNVGTLEVEQTIDDPKAYARPFTTRLTWRLLPETASLEIAC